MGGGTPSVLSLEQLGRIVEALKRAFDLSLLEEFTIEVNPNDVTPEYAAGLVALGVNRVSMGIQSFKDDHLVWMNRRHNASEGKMAVAILREAGINNISIDLISGFEMLSDEDWEYNIKEAILLGPQHISAYQMSIEPGSALGAMYKRGEYAGLSDEECEAQYRTLQRLLAEGGYDQYEISNFALHSDDGRYRSKHNSSYWEGVPYLGLGPAAHSFTGVLALGESASSVRVQARRIWNNPSVKRYCEYYNGGVNGVQGYEELTAADIFNETIMLGLRKCAGFSLELLDAALLVQIEKDIARLVRRGLLVREGSNIRIPAEKLFVSDSIIRELFL
jgi:oxygen-independent coproporphyrinogen-3 oxidase